MSGFLSSLFGGGKAKYGEPLIIVSGLPRSGTSMMMKMLEAGGLPIMTDSIRTADIDNPKGYYEYERVKDLEKETDKSYIKEGRGKVLKVISFLLKDLPDENAYKIIFMRRDLGEVIASQNKMIKHRGEKDDSDDKMMIDAYMNHLAAVRIMVRKRPNFEMVEIRYDTTVQDPKEAARQVNVFLGGKLNEAAMGQMVDADLYRNKKGATV
jgi:hypothetical protein